MKTLADLFIHNDNDLLCEKGMSVDPCSDCSSSQGKFGEKVHAISNSINSQFDLPCVSSKLLTQPNRRGILEVSSSDFKDGMEFSGFTP